MDLALTLLKPRLLGIRNRWVKLSHTHNKGRDVVLFFFSLFIAGTTYWGLHWTLKHLKSMPDYLYINPSLPLGLIFLFLFGLLFVSSAVSALGSFYLASDLELIMAAPISRLALFISKTIYITFSVSWMPCTFLLPALLAFGTAYNAGWEFYVTIVVVFIPYFIIPVAIATIMSTLGMAIIDPRWIKVIAIGVIGVIIAGASYIAKLIISITTQSDNNAAILHAVSFFGRSNIWYSPSTWVSSILSEILHPIGTNISLRILILYLLTITLLCVAYFLIELLHLRGITRSRNNRLAVHKKRRSVKTFTPSLSQALMGKEWRAIFRDVAQSTQILFRSCLALLYLGNLTSFSGFGQAGDDGRWWQTLLFSLHACITAFFTTAIGTRVVFSSVSLEGRQWWILQTSPISTKEILYAKFRFWLFPIAIVSGIIFALGAFVISGRIDVTLAHLVLSLFTTYGLVGLGIGLGAYFADFDWEHPSQLALSIGGFVYMLCSVMLVMLNTIPLWFILKLSNSSVTVTRLSITLLVVVLIIVLNFMVTRIALSVGEKALKSDKFY